MRIKKWEKKFPINNKYWLMINKSRTRYYNYDLILYFFPIFFSFLFFSSNKKIDLIYVTIATRNKIFYKSKFHRSKILDVVLNLSSVLLYCYFWRGIDLLTLNMLFTNPLVSTNINSRYEYAKPFRTCIGPHRYSIKRTVTRSWSGNVIL